MSGRYPGDESHRKRPGGYDRDAGYDPEDDYGDGEHADARRREPAHEPTQRLEPDDGADQVRRWGGPDTWQGPGVERHGAERGQGEPGYLDQPGRAERRPDRDRDGRRETGRGAGVPPIRGYGEPRPAVTQNYQNPVTWTDRDPGQGASGSAGPPGPARRDPDGPTEVRRRPGAWHDPSGRPAGQTGGRRADGRQARPGAGGWRQAPPAAPPSSGQGAASARGPAAAGPAETGRERAWWDDAFRRPTPSRAPRPRADQGQPARTRQPGQQGRPRPYPAQGYGLPPGELTQPIPAFQPQGAYIAPDAYDEDGYTVAYAPSRPYLRERTLREREPQEPWAPASFSVARSTGSMALGTLISRVTGFLRIFVFVFALGAAGLANVYNLANTIPNAVYDIMIGGVLTSVVVPLLVKAAREHRDGGEAYDQRIFTLSVVALGAVTVVATIAAGLLVDVYAAELHGTGHRLTVVFAYFFIPQIFFYGMSSLMGAILNTRNSFAAPMWTPIINNVVVIAVGLLFVVTVGLDKTPENVPASGVLLLGAGTTLGIVIQTLALVPALRKVGFRWRPRFDLRREELAEIGRMAIWMFGYVLSTGVTFVVTTNLANAASQHAPSAGVSAYNYSYALFLLPYAIIGVSVTTALLPRMSRHAAEGDFRLVSEDFSYSIRLSSVILVPAALLLAVLGPALCEFLFSYGSSSVAEARYIGEAFGAFSLGLLPFVIFQLQLRVFYAVHDSRTPAILGFWTMVATIAGNFLALAVLPPGEVVIGMAFVYGITSVFSATIAWRLLNRRVGSLGGRVVTRSLVRMHVASVPALVFAFAVSAGVRVVIHPGAVYGFLTVAIGGGGALLLYLLTAKALRLEELSPVMRMVLGRFGRTPQSP